MVTSISVWVVAKHSVHARVLIEETSVGNVTIRLLPLAALSLSVGGCATTGSPPLQMSVPVAVVLSHVPKANPSAYGVTMPNRLSPQLAEVVVAQGSMAMENVSREFARYGYNGDGPLIAPIGISQSGSVPTEATKTEPDKNVYLVLTNQHGPDSSYNYGTHFLYQGHENGISDANKREMGYVTRINLDADTFHRVTKLASDDKDGNSLPTFDGITWSPFIQRLLLTSETGPDGGVWAATVDFPAVVEDLSGVMGRAGYEGVQNDSDGNVWLVEDVKGAKGTISRNALQPNGHVYRFVPNDKTDLSRGGKLQALQLMSLSNPGQPIVFHADQIEQDIMSQDMKDLHSYGKIFNTRWVTIHDTAIDGAKPFDANAAAKQAFATPFKRPENGQFRPGSQFREFFFDETGDTDQNTQAGAGYGGFGAILKLTQASPSADTGTLTLFYRGNVEHTGFDNLAFWDAQHLLVVEDGGDKLHEQRSAFDSAYLLNVGNNYAAADAPAPVRILALGRDASATVDSYLLKVPGFQNVGDNEITGIHISDGDATTGGLLGAKVPTPFAGGWRVFYTQQHGDNTTYEIIPAPKF